MFVLLSGIILSVFEMLCAWLFYGCFFKRRYNNIVTLLCGAALFMGTQAIIQFVIPFRFLAVLTRLILCTAFCPLFFSAPKKSSYLFAPLVSSLSVCSEILFLPLCENLFLGDDVDYVEKPFVYVSELIFCRIFVFVILVVLCEIYSGSERSLKSSAMYLFYPVSAEIAIAVFWFVSLKNRLDITAQALLAGVSAILLVTVFAVYFAYKRNQSVNREITALRHSMEVAQNDRLYLGIIEKQNDNLRAFAHDTQNHLEVLRNMNTDPDVEKYISEMGSRLVAEKGVSRSGNKFLDVILEKYSSACREKAIRFVADVNNNNLSGVENFDLVTILGNLLDNAVEAAEKSHEKSVLLETDNKNGYGIIIVTNSCDTPPVNGENNLPVSTKTNTALHGIGLKNVKQVLKKYHGDIGFDYDENRKRFSATLMLKY